MEFAPDGRLFILLQGGTIRIYENGSLLSTPFMSIPVHNDGERGLLGIAFDPNFNSNNYIYVYYTTHPSTPPIHNRISRFTANGNVVLPNSEVIIFELNNLGAATNHNGGQLAFKGNFLYAAIGDGGENPNNAQDRTNLFGSILRINKNGTIPSSNPFYGSLSGNNRAIWAYGLRNPFAFDFQPGSNLMYINDVGNQSFEEINNGQAGANYGWPAVEGDTVIGTKPPGYVGPIHTYPIQNNPQCAITGGAFYNPQSRQFPSSYTGDYFFADYCSSQIFVYDSGSDSAATFASNTLPSIVDLEVGPDGALYYLSYANAALSRITYQNDEAAPTISVQPQDVEVGVGQTAQFTCSATGSQPITYRWQRNNSNIPNANSTTYEIASASPNDDNDGANFRCIAKNDFGQATSNSATLSVSPGTAPTPSIAINLPGSANSNLYEAGKMLEFAGSYTDPDDEDSDLPDSSFDWWIDFHHDEHVHPFRSKASLRDRRSDSVQIDDQGHTEANVWLRVYLTVTDTNGLKNTTYIDVYPLVSQLTLNSSPSGLILNLDGQPAITPHVFPSVSGVQRIITAPLTQMLAGLDYSFENWGHGGNASQTIVTPPTNRTYTANYVFRSPDNAAPLRNVFSTATPTLTWGSITWAMGYQVEVSRQSNFSSVDFARDDLDMNTLNVTTSSLPDGVYYWRVRAQQANGSWGRWSPTEIFVIN